MNGAVIRRFLCLKWVETILEEAPYPQIPSFKQGLVSVCAIGPEHRSQHYVATELLRRLSTLYLSEILQNCP